MNALLQKLKIKAPHIMCIMHAPADFEKNLAPLPKGVSVTDNIKTAFDSLHWFVKTKAEVDAQASTIIHLLKPDTRVWCYFPKGTSAIQTDLTRDKGWDALLKFDNIKWLSLVSFNDTWSAFSFRLKTEKDKEEKPKERAILSYADSKTKTITLPHNLSNAFKQHKDAKAFFDTLAFSHKREYIDWIVSAKREETRAKRVERTLQMLLSKKKNPADK